LPQVQTEPPVSKKICLSPGPRAVAASGLPFSRVPPRHRRRGVPPTATPPPPRRRPSPHPVAGGAPSPPDPLQGRGVNHRKERLCCIRIRWSIGLRWGVTKHRLERRGRGGYGFLWDGRRWPIQKGGGGGSTRDPRHRDGAVPPPAARRLQRGRGGRQRPPRRPRGHGRAFADPLPTGCAPPPPVVVGPLNFRTTVSNSHLF